jgi:hypothetical protein
LLGRSSSSTSPPSSPFPHILNPTPTPFPSRLLGWSAFAGFVVLIAGWPLNSYIARRSIRIQKGVLAARDKRMGVLNELIGAVSFGVGVDYGGRDN